jgi:hypothetical protein
MVGLTASAHRRERPERRSTKPRCKERHPRPLERATEPFDLIFPLVTPFLTPPPDPGTRSLGADSFERTGGRGSRPAPEPMAAHSPMSRTLEGLDLIYAARSSSLSTDNV